MEKDQSYKTDWIITVSSSEADGTVVYRFFGSIDDVKKEIMKLAAEDRENDEDCYEYGCEAIDDVEDSSNGCGWLLNAYSTYDDYHIDYQAIQLSHIQSVQI